jgi:hypothetical protein
VRIPWGENAPALTTTLRGVQDQRICRTAYLAHLHSGEPFGNYQPRSDPKGRNIERRIPRSLAASGVGNCSGLRRPRQKTHVATTLGGSSPWSQTRGRVPY